MKVHELARAVPAVAVLALLALVAAAPPGVRPGPVLLTGAPPSQFYPPCETFLASGGGDSTYVFPRDRGIAQPLPVGVTAASCSLRVVGYGWNFARVVLEQWDPLTLAPDAGTIAFRTMWLDPSALQAYTLNCAPTTLFIPPLVTRSVEHVAEPPRLTTALELISQYSLGDFRAYFDPASASALPVARTIGALGAGGPLPGPHPVFAHALCGGDDDLQALRIAQSVMRTSTLPNLAVAEIAQRFRVPEPVELRWIEVAPGFSGAPPALTAGATAAGPGVPRMPLAVPVIGIIDGSDMIAPGATMPVTRVEAALSGNGLADRAVWTSHLDFDHTIVLQPQHDYWLYLRNAASSRYYVATLTGAESQDFAAGIGPYFERDVATNTWGQTVGYALAFRVIGRPMSSVGVAPSSPSRGDLSLRVTPNPARGVADARWSGGVGPVRLEVFDARGRRVATGQGGAAGVWHWSGAGPGGQPLPAGVYFVHARDTAGDHAVERLVIVR